METMRILVTGGGALVEEWADALVMAGHRAEEAQRASP
jgi:hypothetical protein